MSKRARKGAHAALDEYIDVMKQAYIDGTDNQLMTRDGTDGYLLSIDQYATEAALAESKEQER